MAIPEECAKSTAKSAQQTVKISKSNATDISLIQPIGQVIMRCADCQIKLKAKG
jgi:hypothetical protein